MVVQDCILRSSKSLPEYYRREKSWLHQSQEVLQRLDSITSVPACRKTRCAEKFEKFQNSHFFFQSPTVFRHAGTHVTTEQKCKIHNLHDMISSLNMGVRTHVHNAVPKLFSGLHYLHSNFTMLSRESSPEFTLKQRRN